MPSATMPWRFEDEATPWTEALLDRIQSGEEVLVPAHWPLEVVNALLIASRRGRGEQIGEFIEDLAALPIRLEPPSGPAQWPTIVALAEQYRLTAYDAAYLELVRRTGLPLATLDGDLRKAALAEGVGSCRENMSARLIVPGPKWLCRLG